MKKNLLTMALAAGVLLPVSAQWTQVGGTVKVKPNTLKYVTGDFKIVDGTESNEGNVNVQGGFDVATKSGVEFRNEFTSPMAYGQLIINQVSTVTGKVVSEYGTPGKASFAYAKIAIPFTGITAGEIAAAAGIINSPNWQPVHAENSVFSPNRYKNPVFMWQNSDYALKNMQEGDVIGTGDYQPYNYYAVNNYVDNLSDRLSNYAGTPANGIHALSFTSYTISGTKSNHKNKFGEMLGTYLGDDFVNVTPRWSTNVGVLRPEGFGENLFLYGNPYTSNLDITDAIMTEAGNGNIIGVVQQTSAFFNVTVNEGNSNIQSTTKKMITWDPKANGGQGGFTGDVNDYVTQVRPFHTFYVKTTGRDFTLNLGDANKKFEINAAPSYAGNYTRTSNNINSGTNGINQVNVKLFNAEDTKISNTYVVASNSFEASAQAGNEGYVNDLPDDVNAIYTLQETEEGTVDEELANNKMYINGINETKYVGLPVYVVNQVASAGNYTFKFELADQLETSSHKFFFEDKEAGVLKEISSDFEYNFNASETTTDRFAIYWNEGAKLGTGDNVQLASETIIYKVANEFKVRFSKDWNTADVYVYNMLGQLVHSKKGVKTDVDYSLPLANASAAYVVKTVGDNGEVVTKKVIK